MGKEGETERSYSPPKTRRGWRIPRVEYPSETKRRRARERKQADSRLQDLRKPHNELGDELLVNYILELYDESAEGLSIGVVESLAKRCLLQDLLVTEFFDEDGTPSAFAERWYPDINPENYRPLPKPWSAVKQLLKKRLRSQIQESNSQESSSIKIQSLDWEDIAEAYAKEFGRKSIIVLPFSILSYSSKVVIEHEPNFIEPYGGEAHNERAVFIPTSDTYFQGQ